MLFRFSSSGVRSNCSSFGDDDTVDHDLIPVTLCFGLDTQSLKSALARRLSSLARDLSLLGEVQKKEEDEEEEEEEEEEVRFSEALSFMFRNTSIVRSIGSG